MAAKAVLLDPDGPTEIIEIEPDLQGLQELVGGYIESVTLADTGAILVCGEEAKLQGLPVNLAATHLCMSLMPYWNDPIAGRAVVLGISGERMVSCPADVIALATS